MRHTTIVIYHHGSLQNDHVCPKDQSVWSEAIQTLLLLLLLLLLFLCWREQCRD